MLVLIGLALLCMLALLLIIKIFFGLALGLVLLPFRILGAALHLVLGILSAVTKAFFGVLGVVGGVLAFGLVLLALPLLPFLLLGCFVWVLVRAFENRSPLVKA